MIRIFFIALLAACLPACQSAAADEQAPPAASAPAGETAAATGEAAPAPKSQLSSIRPLKGRWRSLRDATYTVEFRGDSMLHSNNGELSMATLVVYNPNCGAIACKPLVEGDLPAGQWCFLEKDSYGEQCNLVVQHTGKRLEYVAVGAAGPTLVFERID